MHERIDDLEARVAFQEDAINQLSDTLYSQQRAIERLEQQVKRLAQRVQGMEERGPGAEPGHEPPPHY